MNLVNIERRAVEGRFRAVSAPLVIAPTVPAKIVELAGCAGAGFGVSCTTARGAAGRAGFLLPPATLPNSQKIKVSKINTEKTTTRPMRMVIPASPIIWPTLSANVIKDT